MVSRQIRPGDYVKMNTGEEGHVVDINWRSTQIREGPNNMIIVPNAKLGAASVTNYYQPDPELVVILPAGGPNMPPRPRGSNCFARGSAGAFRV